MMAFVGILFVSTVRNHGHIGTDSSSQGARKKEPAANDPGAAGDRGRDVVAGSLGVDTM
jgi:hypothetical protein